MNRDEFRQALQRHRLTVEQFAAFIGRTTDTVYRYGETQAVPMFARNVLALLDLHGGSEIVYRIVIDRQIRENHVSMRDNHAK